MSFSTIPTEIGKHAFVKYHGLGNDFIVVDNLISTELKYTHQQAIQLCDRNFGIGADGLIFALPGQRHCDYTMRIFNSDGSEPQMCGNGIRCLAKYLHRRFGKCNEPGQYSIWTNAGLIAASVLADASVKVDMGEPILTPERIPTLLVPSGSATAVIDVELSLPHISSNDSTCYTLKTTPVGMGNPHSVSCKTNYSYLLICMDKIGYLFCTMFAAVCR